VTHPHGSNKKVELSEAMVDWLDKFAHWDVAVTLTLRRTSSKGTPINEKIIFDSIRHYLMRVNHSCHSRRRFNRGWRVGTAAIVSWGTYGDHPHVHMSIASGIALDVERLKSVLREQADRVYWIDKQMKIKDYEDEGWLKYMVEHDPENLIVLELTQPYPE